MIFILFFLQKKFCINNFCVTKFCLFISACVVSLLLKINVQIFVTQPIVMQKKDVAKINSQILLWTHFCHKKFCVKHFCAKKFWVQIFCIFIFERDCIIKSAKKVLRT